MELIFATNNPNKVKEIQHILPAGIKVVSLKEGGINIDIPEPHDTLQANASEKSSVIHRLTGKDCFSEDTGLEVTALNGAPGVKSARYAGENASNEQNIGKLLEEMNTLSDRRARFRTVISLILAGREYFFEGICNGTISREPAGTNGFGYDPVFIPDGSQRTFGEMSLEEKKAFSHRRKATDQLVDFLLSQATI
ncbi:RdgB/HAM1 family non-canonical purine NTP pyrophosphatase [Flavihumibacter stibioxidans]|uniref:dITP/XTP pyrophosphatase n=1 Tax=Flavihumibacter stibioxidans TaxID=1834163 RepID=A0ABR7M571_9BACT|nr:RdgB/HAM1 family non-canonical purine NTP pyrophosphatase [Flavihumibacter stibioxidans]MBC6490061.1 non-canonical purine NTP pyrophosphatase, RdgB/HAM1 family [Flavihumibacter stibioxidans]